MDKHKDTRTSFTLDDDIFNGLNFQKVEPKKKQTISPSHVDTETKPKMKEPKKKMPSPYPQKGSVETVVKASAQTEKPSAPARVSAIPAQNQKCQPQPVIQRKQKSDYVPVRHSKIPTPSIPRK